MVTFSSALLVVATVSVEILLTGVCGVTLARRCSWLWVQLRVQSWQEAQNELQQGKKRQMLTRHRNQPGDQQHQQSTTLPATTPRRMYRTSKDRETGESGNKRGKIQFIWQTYLNRQSELFSLYHYEVIIWYIA